MGDESASELENIRKEGEDEADVEGHHLVKSAAEDEEASEEPDVEGHNFRKS